MNFDSEEEWTDQDVMPEAGRNVAGPDSKWVKNPDGTWRKVSGKAPASCTSATTMYSPSQSFEVDWRSHA